MYFCPSSVPLLVLLVRFLYFLLFLFFLFFLFLFFLFLFLLLVVVVVVVFLFFLFFFLVKRWCLGHGLCPLVLWSLALGPLPLPLPLPLPPDSSAAVFVARPMCARALASPAQIVASRPAPARQSRSPPVSRRRFNPLLRSPRNTKSGYKYTSSYEHKLVC